ncbi:MAG: InlB B-repeat-containing protein [Christensenellales bacterium]|jgi:uncharacterized repeat protein (TIGR02543 family)
MKKLISVTIIIVIALVFTACEFNWDLFNDLASNNEDFADIVNAFNENIPALLEEQNVPQNIQDYYNQDITTALTFQLMELAYFAAIAHHIEVGETESKTNDLTVTSGEDGENYILTNENDEIITVKTTETSTSIKIESNNNVIKFFFEKIILSDTSCASQYYLSDDNKLYMLYIAGNTGRLAYCEDVESAPESIYNAPAKITNEFATGGYRNYVIGEDEFAYTGDFFNNIEPQYKITFETNGAPAIESVTVATLNPAPAVTRAGYTFTGWYLSSDLSGEPVIFPFTPDSNLTLYAGWEQ